MQARSTAPSDHDHGGATLASVVGDLSSIQARALGRASSSR
jgi:hypothetical protein